eukprot:TRINITY_DN11504_c0_g1_i8.p3 TRINITY_DN11504_c0_g1~~TRINITY_DN11504_c0_g1_i8.p3  ORF type:complete len:133 (-),score=3.22 TRINITY_DN11504_c0_g1_i8:74-472(-)
MLTISQHLILLVCFQFGLHTVVVKRYKAGVLRVLVCLPQIICLIIFPLHLDAQKSALTAGTLLMYFCLAALKVLGFAIGRGPLVFKEWTFLQSCVILFASIVPQESFMVLFLFNSLFLILKKKKKRYMNTIH